jgi:hypothetical protein
MKDTSDKRVFKIEDKPEVYPGIYFWNSKMYVLVKDGIHYPISKRKMDVMVAECKGHHEEIVKHYKPRIKKEKDPNIPKVPRKKRMSEESSSSSNLVKSTPTWIHKDYQDKGDGHKYNQMGFRIS